MPRISINLEPSIVKYARYCSGYDIKVASEKIKISEENLRLLEAEGGDLLLGKVKAMANVYKMPLAYFLLKTPPKGLVIPKDFRIVFPSEDRLMSHDLMAAVRKARYSQSIIQEFTDNPISYSFKNFTISDNPEKVGEYFRSIINIPISKQKKWPNPATAFREWKDAIEKLGIFIFQQSKLGDGVSAFCLADENPYIIILNSSEHENRRIFSLFHEVGHILIKSSGICNPEDLSKNSFAYKKIEKFCNQFASAFLVPEADFIKNERLGDIQRLPFNRWGDYIKPIANSYGVSQEVIYRKLVQVGLLEEDEYENKRKDLISGFLEYKKNKKGKKIIIPEYIKIISKNGKAFTSLVLDNLNSGKITMVNAADFLNTNSRHISNVESHI